MWSCSHLLLGRLQGFSSYLARLVVSTVSGRGIRLRIVLFLRSISMRLSWLIATTMGWWHWRTILLMSHDWVLNLSFRLGVLVYLLWYISSGIYGQGHLDTPIFNWICLIKGKSNLFKIFWIFNERKIVAKGDILGAQQAVICIWCTCTPLQRTKANSVTEPSKPPFLFFSFFFLRLLPCALEESGNE